MLHQDHDQVTFGYATHHVRKLDIVCSVHSKNGEVDSPICSKRERALSKWST